MDIRKKPSYNVYRNNENSLKLIYKNDKSGPLNTPRFKTSSNTKSNSKIVDKKYKRDEILCNSKNKNVKSPDHSKKLYNINDKSNYKKDGLIKEDVAQTLFDFTFPNIHKKDKEGLIVDLYHVSNEMDEQNNKLEELHQEYENLISNSLAYKVIIEKILSLDENGNNIKKSDENNNKENNVNNNINTDSNMYKIKEKSKSDNNFKITNNNNTINENKEYLPTLNSITNQSNSNKNNNNNMDINNFLKQIKHKKNKIQMNYVFSNETENATKINVLLRENNILKKKLSEKEKKLDKIKSEEKIKNFEELVEK
jgi:hypothetical protein